MAMTTFDSLLADILCKIMSMYLFDKPTASRSPTYSFMAITGEVFRLKARFKPTMLEKSKVDKGW